MRAEVTEQCTNFPPPREFPGVGEEFSGLLACKS